MIALRKLVLAAAIAAGSGLSIPQQVNAFELTGAWATSADQCSKVFARKGRANQVNFTNFSGVYGLIKSRKESDQIINLVVACASSIMVSNVQFFLKVLDENTITREFPGMEGMDVTYHRCQI
jgi:hypothetical protein